MKLSNMESMSKDINRYSERNIHKLELSKTYLIYYFIIAIAIIIISVAIDISKNNVKVSGKDIWFGVETIEISPAIQLEYNINTSTGLLVARTFMGSPAEVAGIQQGDVIKRWNGKSIISHNEFKQLIQSSRLHERVQLSIDRQNKPMLVYVKLGLRPGKF